MAFVVIQDSSPRTHAERGTKLQQNSMRDGFITLHISVISEDATFLVLTFPRAFHSLALSKFLDDWISTA